jgi:hypothetical protein
MLPNVKKFDHRLWEIPKATKYLEKALKMIAKYLKLKNFNDPETLKTTFQIMVFDKSEPSAIQTQKLKLLFILVKGFLQNGAVKSQSMQHQEALVNVNFGKFYLKTLIYNLEEQIKIYNKATEKLERGMEFKNEDEKAYFSAFLQIPELKKFKNLSSNSMLIQDFERFIHEVLLNDPTERPLKDMYSPYNHNEVDKTGVKNVIFWKYNLENNEKYFKKELSARSRDLGVNQKLTSMWLRDFNIGNVMHIKPMSYLKVSSTVEFCEYFNMKLVIEVVLTYCCSLFSIATENRFICQKLLELETKPSEFKGPAKKASKIYKLQKNPNFIES